MPPETLETPRLLLRPLTLADLDDFVALHADPEVTRYIRAFDRAAAHDRLLAAQDEWDARGHGLFAVLDKTTGRFLGRSGLRYWPQLDETEVGWVLHRDVWGQGLAAEAGKACVDWGFRHLPVPYLTAMIHPDNATSARVAERLGFAPLRSDALGDVPVVVYARQSDPTM